MPASIATSRGSARSGAWWRSGARGHPAETAEASQRYTLRPSHPILVWRERIPLRATRYWAKCLRRAQDGPQLSDALVCGTLPLAMGACSHLAEAVGDELEDSVIRKLQEFHRCARFGAAIRSKAAVADGAAAGSTMRRRHWMDRQVWTEFRAVLNGHTWKDAINSV